MVRKRVLVLLAAAVPLMAATVLQAQTTSELSGRVMYEGQGMPGVSVRAASPALQGQRITISNAQGDYIFKHLPAGDYNVTFELETFKSLTYELKITTAQPKYLDAVMYPEAMQEEIVVAGQYETVSSGAQGSETIEQTTLEKLPVERSLNAAVLLSAGVESRGGISISGGSTWASLFTMNGVVLNENLNGQPYPMYIEDAILETTTMTNSMSAEYGRFDGGVVNMVTKSGGNEFSGSFRASYDNDSWNGASPMTVEQTDEVNSIYEATFGGYLWRDKLWFFLAGRTVGDSDSRQIVTPGQPEAAIPYTMSQDEDHHEAKLTWGITPSHRLMGSYIKRDTVQYNTSFFPPADEASIDPQREMPLEGISATYTGVFSDNFFLEALYSERYFGFLDSGGEDQRLGATPVWDPFAWVGFNAHIFCGSCTPEERNNANYYAKASYFFSGAGTHDLVFGFDLFDDIVLTNNYQSATGYVWIPYTQQDYSEPGNPLVSIVPWASFIAWGDVLEETDGNSFKTKSAYVNDTWRVSDRVTLNLGLRYDSNDGTDSGGAKTVDDSRWSPRLSGTWDVRGDGKIILTGGASRYVAQINNWTGDAGAAAGGNSWAEYIYAGPLITAGTPEYPTNYDALEAMFDWFLNVYGGPSNTQLLWGQASVPGLTPKVGEHLRSHYADELTVGASIRLGSRGVLRLDYVHRDYGDFHATEIVPDRWVTEPDFGLVLDLGLLVNEDDLLDRTYDGFLARFDYRLGGRWSFGGNYTWARHSGNMAWNWKQEGDVRSYQEYKDVSWNSPSVSVREHKLRAWAIWDVIATSHHNLSLSLLQNFWPGSNIIAGGSINTVPFVGEPEDLGYAGSPGNVWYAFDLYALQLDDVTRTDIALNYSFFVNFGGGQLELFLQPEVINVFNESTVDSVNSTVLTAVNHGSGLEAFDPWETDPVEGVHWMKGSQFGEPTDERDFQQPRTFRFSVGLRF